MGFQQALKTQGEHKIPKLLPEDPLAPCAVALAPWCWAPASACTLPGTVGLPHPRPWGPCSVGRAWWRFLNEWRVHGGIRTQMSRTRDNLPGTRGPISNSLP